MRQLLPRPTDQVDLAVLDERSDRRTDGSRPWVMANMVMSVDGAYAVDGRSAGLGSPGDKEIFHRLRAAADVVLVAAGTARTERYRRPHLGDTEVERRRSQGLQDHPRLAIVSASLSLPDDLPLLGGPGQVPLVLHPDGADTAGVPDGVELRSAGGGPGVDLAEALAGLRRDGAEVVLSEGGPSLLGQLHRDGLLDELFVTVAPWLVGGRSVGLLGNHDARVRPLALHRLLEQDGSLFATYRTD
jgi:5-amino-6-(5-phosphoribosylamino)uracil reductase